jgi:hypothetical protein
VTSACFDLDRAEDVTSGIAWRLASCDAFVAIDVATKETLIDALLGFDPVVIGATIKV